MCQLARSSSVLYIYSGDGRYSMRSKSKLLLSIWLLIFASGSIEARKGSGEGNPDSRVDRINERAQRDAVRNVDRAAREEQRYREERAKIIDESAKDPDKASRDLAKLEADRQEELEKAAADSARDAEDYAEDMEKALHEQYEDKLENLGSSENMRDLAEQEEPEFDDKGFPVRKGELTALDLDDTSIEKLKAKGFQLISRDRLDGLASQVTRFAVPKGMVAEDSLRLAKETDPEAVFDYTHYYEMQYAPSGAAAAAVPTALTRKKGNLTVGLIDTGIISHSFLKSASITEKKFGSNETSPTEHGTAVASILVSEGASKLYVANIFRGSSNRPYTSADALVKALNWMVESRMPVVNISLAGPRNAILDKLVERAIGKGTVIVAAAGNGGPSAPPAYPAALPAVIAVTAVDRNMRVYRYANQGPYITVASRGVGQAAAKSSGGFGNYSGTSFATPHVAAWIARCMKGRGAVNCAQKMRRSARDLGAPGYDPVYGHGYIG